ncbi:hypothetical protein [Bacillus sp. Marseille-P3661]|uniref:hypothetical protein n=1 Tax=Bacillus sp. Marseille-P3661 TaxID=1936234 RepID=UPI000C846FFD|nr:hypothetical protein [Bacillus sp. Marseille-P3661]
MNIHIAIAGLVYLLLLVIAYEITIFTNLEKEKSEEIISRAYNYAYGVLIFGLLIVYILLMLPLTIDYQVASSLIIASKFSSIVTLGATLYLLTKKRCEYRS